MQRRDKVFEQNVEVSMLNTWYILLPLCPRG